MTDTLTITRPDDWHLHVRDGAALEAVVPHSARQFGRALIMPNLRPPVTTAAQAVAYRDRIRAAVPEGTGFEPVMSLYLTDKLPPEEIALAAEAGVRALKLYPAGATTNSQHGVTDIRRAYPVLETMQKIGMPLLLHGEVTDREVDIFDREQVYIDRVLTPLLKDFPALKIVLEHITTAEAASFVDSDTSGRLGATITSHHLMINRNAIFEGGVRPHFYCLPVAKREKHRLALRKAAISGKACFFLGTDTAPHAAHTKENACGCAGIFNAPTAMQSYAQVFHEEGALDKLEAFASLNGPAFYGLPVNSASMTITQSASQVPEEIAVGSDRLVVFAADTASRWTLSVT